MSDGVNMVVRLMVIDNKNWFYVNTTTENWSCIKWDEEEFGD